MVCVYDSGVGGLSVLSAIRRVAPQCDIVYLGDTAHVPYGTRSHAAITDLARLALDYLAVLSPTLVLVACGTVSTVSLPRLTSRYRFPAVGVAEAGVRAALRASPHRRIAVLGTEATIDSGYFPDRILQKAPGANVQSLACPLFVALAECGLTAADDPIPRLAAERLLAPLTGMNAEAVVLGCTHFAWLLPHIARALPGATPVDCGTAAVQELASLLCREAGTGRTDFLVTDNPEGFSRTAARVLGGPLAAAPRRVSLLRRQE